MAKQSEGAFSFDFKSGLKSGADRFLSRMIVHALEDGWRTPEDFLKHFNPHDLMGSLDAAPELRRNILVVAVGVHEKIAKKKSTQSAAEDLALALDEGVTSPADILSLLPPDDRVRYLDHQRLWSFVVEDEFYSAANSIRHGQRAVDRMTYTLEAAMSEALLSLQDVADGLGFDTISRKLPLDELQKVLEHALSIGREGRALTEESMLDVVPLRSLVGFIPLDQTWERVVVEKVARPAMLTGMGGTARGRKESSSRKDKDKSAPPASNGKKDEEARAAGKEKGEDLRSVEDDVDDLLEATSDSGSAEERSPAEEEARGKVVTKLREIERLPPSHDRLSTAILLSIESMYAELLSTSSDEAREELIRDSFPNTQHMTTALLALIELLDPSIDTRDSVIRDADVDSLIKVVLFEERQRYEKAHPSQRPPAGASTPPPLPGGARRASSGGPPPLPRSVPPPLPTAEKSR